MNFVPTLQNFKDLLGNVNDGNIAFTENGQGLEKVNHGNIISRKIHDYRQVPSNAEANEQIRRALMAAISNSSEGKALRPKQLGMIREMLGLGDDNRLGDDLTRKELKLVLDSVELMVRGEKGGKSASKTGRISASVKDIPSVKTNKLVKGQIKRLEHIGYPIAKYEKVIGIAMAETQKVSFLFDEDILDDVFAKGFEGHTKKEMVRFARNSAAHIQSQIFDKLFWMCVDSIETDQERKRLAFNAGTTKDVFLQVIREMTVSYAKGEEPIPCTDKLLDRLPAAAEQPANEQVALSVDGQIRNFNFGDPGSPIAITSSLDIPPKVEKIVAKINGITAKFNDFVNLLSSEQVGFERRQLENFVSQLTSAFNAEMRTFATNELVDRLYGIYKNAFEGSDGASDAKQAAANKAVDEFVDRITDRITVGRPVMDLLNGISVMTLAACRKGPNVAGFFRQEFAKIIADEIGRPGCVLKLDGTTLASVCGKVHDKILPFFDLKPLARAIMAKLNIDQDDAEKCQKIVDALASEKGELGERVRSFLTLKAETELKNPNVKIDGIVAGFLGPNDGLIASVKKSLGGEIDLEAIQKARDRQFAAAAIAVTPKGTPFIEYRIPVRTEEQVSEKIARLDMLIANNGGPREKETVEEYESRYQAELKELNDKLTVEMGKRPVVKEEVDNLEKKIDNLMDHHRSVQKFLREKASYSEDYVKKVSDPVFCGKLVLICECGLLDDRPDLKALIVSSSNGGIEITPENVDDAKRICDEVLASVSLNDLKTLVGYVSEGYSWEDAQDFRHLGANTFRKLYYDGQFDFAGVKLEARKFLIDNIHFCVRNRGVPPGEEIADYIEPPINMTQEAFAAFYAEYRDGLKPVIEKVNAGNPEAIEKALKAAGIESEKPPTFADFNFSKLKSYKEGGVSSSLFTSIWGFGTGDPKAVRNALLRVGLTQQDVNEPAGWLKAYRLSVIIKMHGDRIDGAVEWAERVTGKSFDEIRFGDLFKLNKLYASNKPIDDPQDKLKGDLSTVARFLSGQATLAESKLLPDDMPALINGLRSLASGAKSAALKLFGLPFVVSVAPNGSLTARLDVGDGKKMSVAVARSLDELIAQIENQVVDHAMDYQADRLFGVLPNPPEGVDPIARPRELYSKALSTLLNLPSVNFAHLSTKDLYDTIHSAIDPKKRAALVEKFAIPPTSYNSAETIELQAKYLKTDSSIRTLVKVPKSVDKRSKDERALDFVSELVMNADTWAYDVGMKVKGSRIAALIASGRSEIERLTTVKPGQSDLIGELPVFLQKGIREILTRLAEVAGNVAAMKEEDRPAACAQIEEQIDAFVKTSMEYLQAQATMLFGASRGDRRENWKKSLGEMSGADGLSPATSQGRFTKRVLDKYFVKCDPIEKRSMLANVLRNARKDSSPGKLVGEMLKGAGPLLQKTLQGLSAGTFGPETRLALKDMKSKLLPISDSVIQAQLLELVRSSNGEILSIEVKKSLGQATVGQALLCHILTKDHPICGEDVVIKILRPNVQTAVQREYKVFLDIAAELDAEEKTGASQQDTFKGRYQTVLKEFDFTLESANIDLCRGVYEKPTAKFSPKRTSSSTEHYDKLHSMDRHHAVSPMSGMLVLQKVEGKPVDRLLEDSRAEVDEILGGIKVTTQLGVDVGLKTTVYEAKSPGEMLDAKAKLWNLRQDLINKHASLVKLVDIWFEKALFGDGVFHNDLHPGNVMVNGTEVSVIDFGNVARLTADQQMVLVYLFSAAMTGTVDDFVDGVKTLLGTNSVGNESALKSALTDVLAKGSSADVIPRMLAALSVLKDHAVPIPETVHNFAESMSRIQEVIDGIVGEVDEIEEISDAMVFQTEDAAVLKLDQTKFSKDDMPVINKLFDDVNAVLKTLGTPEKKFDPAACKAAADSFYEVHKGNAPFDEFSAEINQKVFSRDDGGVEYIKALLDMLAMIPESSYKEIDDIVSISHGREYIRESLKAYQRALANGFKKEIDSARRVLLSNLRSGILGVVGAVSSKYDAKGPIIFEKVKCGNFVESVGNSLQNRIWRIQLGLAKFKKIKEERFVKVMEMNDAGASQSDMVLEMKLDTLNFIALKSISEKLSKETENKDNAEKYFKLFAGKLKPGDMSSQEIKTMKRSAWDFRFPGAWNLPRSYTIKGGEDMAKYYIRGKEDFDKHTVKEVRNVFQENLNALKNALKTEKPTKEQIEFFAQLAASTTRGLSFGDTFRQYDEQKLNEIAGDSQEIKTFLTAYKEAMDVIIGEENRAAEAARKAEEAARKAKAEKQDA